MSQPILSTIKLEAYNECPGARVIEKELASRGFTPLLDVADALRDYYQNDSATLVLRVRGDAAPGFTDGLRLAQFAEEMMADEFTYLLEPGGLFIRIWWD